MSTKSNKYKRTKIKFSVFSLAIYLIGILIFTYWNYQNDKKILMYEVDSKIYSAASNIRNILPKTFFDNKNNNLIIKSDNLRERNNLNIINLKTIFIIYFRVIE